MNRLVKICLATICLNLPVAARAQTNAAPQVSYVTNMVEAAPNFRLVNGQLYNIEKSYRWREYQGTVVQTYQHLLFVQTYTEKRHYRSGRSDSLVSSGNFLGSSGGGGTPGTSWVEKVPGPVVAVTNYPASTTRPDGEAVTFSAMETGTHERDDQHYTLLDFGTPNIVPVVKAVTNVIAAKP